MDEDEKEMLSEARLVVGNDTASVSCRNPYAVPSWIVTSIVQFAFVCRETRDSDTAGAFYPNSWLRLDDDLNRVTDWQECGPSFGGLRIL